MENKVKMQYIPSIYPASGAINSLYGMRTSPITGRAKFHKGIDISAPIGSSVLATAKGKVIATKFHVHYGKYILIEHKDYEDVMDAFH